MVACGNEWLQNRRQKSRIRQIIAVTSFYCAELGKSKRNNPQCFDYLFVIKNSPFLCGVFIGHIVPNKHSKYSLNH